jgi:hypothetical protein
MSMTESTALASSAFVAGLGSLVLALQDVKNRKEYSDLGLMSSSISELYWRPRRFRFPQVIQRAFFGETAFDVLIVTRVAGSIALVASALRGEVTLTILVLLVAVVLSNIRSAYGGDGADQMITIVLAGLAITRVSPAGHAAHVFAMWFITLQLIASYFIAGVAKIVSSDWQTGSGLVGILATESYGSRTLTDFTRSHMSIAQLTSWGVIAFETGFILVLVLPPALAAIFFAAGAIFHISTALVMSLNTFLFSFLAAYPIAWYCLAS